MQRHYISIIQPFWQRPEHIDDDIDVQRSAAQSSDSKSWRSLQFQMWCRGAAISQQVVIGTHGKLKNWQSKRMLTYRSMKILVMDEADEMLKVSCFWFLWDAEQRCCIIKCIASLARCFLQDGDLRNTYIGSLMFWPTREMIPLMSQS